MATLHKIVTHRCFGNSWNILNRTNIRTIIIKNRKIALTENYVHTLCSDPLCNKTPVQLCIAVKNNQLQYFSTETPSNKPEEKKPSLYQRLKSMYKDYWYVLVPVHCVTSAFWFGSFYYLAKSGVDIVALLESLNISERFIEPLRNGHSTTGYLALAYALYKIATPLRYTVTIGGTTFSINYLKQWGYIKPMPSKEQLKVMYKEQKESFEEKKQELRDTIQERKQEFKDNVFQKFKDIDGKKKA